MTSIVRKLWKVVGKVRQAHPLDHDTLCKLYNYIDFSKELEAVTWVAILVGFNLILRVSNLGPAARKDFDPEKHLIRSDLTIHRGILVRWAKNIEYCNKIMWYP